MNTRKGLGHNCSSCHLSLSSSLTRSPSNYINHTHRHTALGVGLFVFCLVLFFFYTVYYVKQIPSTTQGARKFFKLGYLFDPKSPTYGQIPPILFHTLLNLSCFLPGFLFFCFPYFLQIHKLLLHIYYVPVLLIELQWRRHKNKQLKLI